MAAHSEAEQENPTVSLPSTDSESDLEQEVDDEALENRMTTTYLRRLNHPMKEPLTAPWDLPISDADMEKLKAGFRSFSMDDKYDFLVEDPDQNGNLSVHIIRAMLHEECFIMHIIPKSSNDNGSAKMHSITWEGNKAGFRCDAEQAKKEAVVMSRIILNCEFKTLPDYPKSVVWDRNAYEKLDTK